MNKNLFIRALIVLGLLTAACRTSMAPSSSGQPAANQPAVNEPAATELAMDEAAAPTQPGQAQQITEASPETTIEEPAAASTPTTSTAAVSALTTKLPAGPLTLITLGDSLTEGSGDYDLGIGYPGRLLSKIEALRPGSQLYNFGHSGWSSDDLVKGNQDTQGQLGQALNAVAEAKAAGQPALVTVWIGSNDLWYLYEYGPDPMTVEAEESDLANFRQNLNTILAELSGAGAVVLVAQGDDQSLRPVVSNPPNPAEPAFTAISPSDLERMSDHILQYNQIIAELAAQYGAGVVDFYHTSLFVDPATLDGDGNHPNSAGYDQITEIWFMVILPLIKE